VGLGQHDSLIAPADSGVLVPIGSVEADLGLDTRTSLYGFERAALGSERG
jgi:hypothetical protein